MTSAPGQNFRVRTKKRPKWLIPAIAGGAVLVLAIAGGITAAVVLGAPATVDPKPTDPKSQGDPDPVVPPTPRTALIVGSPVAWAIAPSNVVAAVGPEVGDPADGAVALRIEAPVVAQPVSAVSADILVKEGVTYNFSASVRSLDAASDSIPAWFTIAGVKVELPPLTSEWAVVTADIEIPAGVEAPRIALELGGAVKSVSIDQLSLIEAGTSGNLIPNASFEEAVSAGWLLNESLVLASDAAALAVAVPPGDLSWTATDAAGVEVARGSKTIASPIEAVPLEGIPQGFITINLTHPDGVARQVTVAVVDSMATLDPRFGVTTHLTNSYSGPAPRLAASLGYGMVRNDVLWQDNEVTAGSFDFLPAYDVGFGGLRANDVGLLAIIDYGNPNYDDGGVPISADAVAAYSRYAGEVVARYSPRAVEVFNEFNHTRFNTSACGVEPECYLPMLTGVKQQLAGRGFDDVTVIAGSTALYEGSWFDGLWDLGGLSFADAMSYHPYEAYENPQLLVDTIRHARASMNARGGEVPIWITELGWTTKSDGVSQRVQAERLVEAETLALASGAENFFWYDLINDLPDPGAHEGNFGLFGQLSGGIAANQPKLAAFTQALLINHLAGRDFSRLDEFGDTVTSAVFGTGEDEVRVAWTAGEANTVSIPSGVALELTAIDGTVSTVEPTDGMVSVVLTGSPLLISPAKPLSEVK